MALMATLRVEVRLPYVTNLPRDLSINVLHWNTVGDPNDADFLAITSEIDSFFNLEADAPDEDFDGLNIARYMSSVISRESGACRVRFYNIEDDPIILLAETQFTLEPHAEPSSNMPNEMAICCSLTATPALPVLLRNRRGRLYLGPVTSLVIGGMDVAGEEYPAVSSLVRELLAHVLERMATGPTTVLWQIYSRVNEEAYEVSGGFIDNEFDTQRRRQVPATARTVWGLPA